MATGGSQCTKSATPHYNSTFIDRFIDRFNVCVCVCARGMPPTISLFLLLAKSNIFECQSEVLVGALMGGSQCRMSILRNGVVCLCCLFPQ